MHEVVIRNVETFCYRVPLTAPVVTSFGRMDSRPGLFVSLTDSDGVRGWGEVWCNFPSVGVEHRMRIIDEILAPMLRNYRAHRPEQLFHYLSDRMRILAIQAGEPGPFAQAIAGLDIAAWDLFARRRKEPLWRMMGGANVTIPVYASGINPMGCEDICERAALAGHRAFKLKIGFDALKDRTNVAALRRLVGSLPLAVDANQAWEMREAPALASALDEFELAWIEEPITADYPWQSWRAIAAQSRTPLAGGENITGEKGFVLACDADVLSVVQPDIAKWGGLTMGLVVGRQILAAGRRFCPHYLGGGIGLQASAHLLAAVGGDGVLEVDINPNPLRECSFAFGKVEAGTIKLSTESGLGTEPDLNSLGRFRVRG